MGSLCAVTVTVTVFTLQENTRRGALRFQGRRAGFVHCIKHSGERERGGGGGERGGERERERGTEKGQQHHVRTCTYLYLFLSLFICLPTPPPPLLSLSLSLSLSHTHTHTSRPTRLPTNQPTNQHTNQTPTHPPRFAQSGRGACPLGPVSCRVTTVARRSSSQLDSHLTTVIRLIGYHERRRRSLDCRNLRHRRVTDRRGLPHA